MRKGSIWQTVATTQRSSGSQKAPGDVREHGHARSSNLHVFAYMASLHTLVDQAHTLSMLFSRIKCCLSSKPARKSLVMHTMRCILPSLNQVAIRFGWRGRLVFAQLRSLYHRRRESPTAKAVVSRTFLPHCNVNWFGFSLSGQLDPFASQLQPFNQGRLRSIHKLAMPWAGRPAPLQYPSAPDAASGAASCLPEPKCHLKT